MKLIPVSSIKTKAQFAAAYRKMWREVIRVIKGKKYDNINIVKKFAFDKYFIGDIPANCWGCAWEEHTGKCLFNIDCNTVLCCHGAWKEISRLNCITENERALSLARKILNMKIRGIS